MNPFDTLAELTEKKRDLKNELAEVQSKMTALEPVVMDHMDTLGVSNSKLSGNRGTVGIVVTPSAAPAEGISKEDLIAELGRHDETSWLVSPKYVSQTFNSWYREQLEQDSMPDWAHMMIRKVERRSVRITKT